LRICGGMRCRPARDSRFVVAPFLQLGQHRGDLIRFRECRGWGGAVHATWEGAERAGQSTRLARGFTPPSAPGCTAGARAAAPSPYLGWSPFVRRSRMGLCPPGGRGCPCPPAPAMRAPASSRIAHGPPRAQAWACLPWRPPGRFARCLPRHWQLLACPCAGLGSAVTVSLWHPTSADHAMIGSGAVGRLMAPRSMVTGPGKRGQGLPSGAGYLAPSPLQAGVVQGRHKQVQAKSLALSAAPPALH